VDLDISVKRKELFDFDPRLDQSDFRHKVLPEFLNILVFGGVGVGKSGLVNTLLSAFSPKIVNIQECRPSQRPVTNSFHVRYLTEPQPSKIRVCDTWGWENNNYVQNEFNLILKGRMKAGHKKEDGVTDGLLRAAQSAAAMRYEIHCVIFVVTARLSDNLDYLNKLKRFAQESQKADVPYVIAITQLDVDNEDISSDPACAVTSSSFNEKKNKLATEMGINSNMIFPIVNYGCRAQPDFFIDLMAVQLLYWAKENAKFTWIRQNSDAAGYDKPLFEILKERVLSSRICSLSVVEQNKSSSEVKIRGKDFELVLK